MYVFQMIEDTYKIEKNIHSQNISTLLYNEPWEIKYWSVSLHGFFMYHIGLQPNEMLKYPLSELNIHCPKK